MAKEKVDRLMEAHAAAALSGTLPLRITVCEHW
ncbi:hypothetical protein X741_22915 [Mesorhizobium sp. LNHC229A00]|nr:hypothetical protein X741_22915 [Mesorhizobium sp. LNHC229A00]